MRRRESTKIAVLTVLLLAVSVAAGCQTPTAQPVPEQPPTAQPEGVVSIPELKGPEGKRFVGESVTVEGIFVRDPVPMLVTDLRYVQMNMPVPEEEYLILHGGMAEEISADEFGGARLRVTGVVNAPGEENEDKPQVLYMLVTRFDMLERLSPYAPKYAEIVMATMINPSPTRYAILFSGGINVSANYSRYWNDLKFMYKTLTGTLGFPKKNIAVLYADGKAVDNDMTVDYAATQANLKTAFDLLRKNSTDKDLVFFFSTNHGAGFYTNDPDKKYNIYGGAVETGTEEPNDSISEATYKLDLNNDGDKNDTVAWDEALNAWKGTSATASKQILDDDLQSIFDKIKYNRMVIVMEQCFSGGLIHDVARSSNRVIISAAGEYEPSWCMTGGKYNEFSYHFTSAINKADPSGTKVDADTNKDGHVSLVEAFNYARSKDVKSETPWYEDSGDGIPHSGAMPSGGEGTLGGSLTLEP